MKGTETKMPKEQYEIMHMDRKVARIDESGHCKIYFKSFMPYNLYFEEADDIDTYVNNITNFNYWCATRVLTLDRTYAKEILNSIGMLQSYGQGTRKNCPLLPLRFYNRCFLGKAKRRKRYFF